MLSRLATGCALFVCATSLAHATWVSDESWDGEGKSLQELLNSITDGGQFLDVNNDQAPLDELWRIQRTGQSGNTLLFEIAGYANVNTFGIYDKNDPTRTLEIFSGLADPGFQATLYEDPLSPGSFAVCYSPFSGGGCNSAEFTSSVFGFYLTNGENQTFYSEAERNGGDDHMVAFYGDGSLNLDPYDTGFAAFGPGEYILAWEDLPLNNSDRDYNDFVVIVESVTPVSEPGSLALIGAGLLLVGAWRRRAMTAVRRS